MRIPTLGFIWSGRTGWERLSTFYTSGDEKLEALRLAQNPPEIIAMAKLATERADITLQQLNITKNIEAITAAVGAEALTHVVHAGLVADMGKVEAKLTKGLSMMMPRNFSGSSILISRILKLP